MRKLVLIPFLISSVYADGPYYKQKDPVTQLEFEQCYQEIRGTLSHQGNNVCIDPQTFCVDIVNHKVNLSSTTLTMDGTSPTITQSVGGSISSYNVLSSSFAINGNNLRATAGGATFTIPNSGTANFVMTEGVQAINGAKTLTGVLSLSAGAVAAPSVNFADSTTGIYRVASNQLGITLNGAKSTDWLTTGTSDATLYQPFNLYAGAGTNNKSAFDVFTQTSITTAKQIAQINEGPITCFVYGQDGSGNDFYDIVASGINTNTPSTVLSSTSKGAPAGRTYSKSTTLVMNLAMASGTYSTKTLCIDIGPR